MKNSPSRITFDEIMAMDNDKRTTFINTLSGFKSAGLIGTKNKIGQANLAIFNSFVHIGANPPLIGFICRPSSVERHTLENILETGVYTINHINESYYKQAHQTSARYERQESEFEATNLTEEYLNNFYAPFVMESQIKIAVAYKEKIDILINGTILIIGQVKEVYFPSDCLKEDGYLDINNANSIAICGLDSYFKTEHLSRLAYAKVGKELLSK